MGGKLKIGGNIMLSQKLQALFKAQQGTKNAAAAPAPSEAAASATDRVFTEMSKLLSPDMVAKVKAVFLWKVTQKDGKVQEWTVDLKNAPGSVYKGAPRDGGKADCTLALAEQDLVELVSGKLDAMKAFMGGKLKLSGNIMLSRKLQPLFKPKSRL
eukprot:m.114559 g.114559  ORF g.114559 m.114559 type:complete len:156 (-) comp19356_c0_seq3:30-497(-)